MQKTPGNTQRGNADPKTQKRPGATQGVNLNPNTQKVPEVIQGGEPRKPESSRARRRRESQLITAAPLEGISPLGYWQEVNQSPTQTKPYNTLPPFEPRDSWSSYGAVRAYSDVLL